jgi:phospholipase C
MRLPEWNDMAILITYDDADGWYDHVMPPIVSKSNDSANDSLFGSTGLCGTPAPGAYLDRCGYGTRLPFLVISPFAKQNFVDSTLTDTTSILRFIEDNWNLGRIGNGSADAYAGSINGMFNFTGPAAKPLFLDPAKGTLVSGGSASGLFVTAAVAGPKNATTVNRQFQLDGTASTSFDGKPLSYQWSMVPGSPQAGIGGAFTATPTIQFGVGRGAYTFQLVVTDSAGGMSTDTITVNFTGD